MITVESDYKNNTYRVLIDYQDDQQHMNGTAITLTEAEALGLHACLGSALGLGPEPSGLRARPVTNTSNSGSNT